MLWRHGIFHAHPLVRRGECWRVIYLLHNFPQNRFPISSVWSLYHSTKSLFSEYASIALAIFQRLLNISSCRAIPSSTHAKIRMASIMQFLQSLHHHVHGFVRHSRIAFRAELREHIWIIFFINYIAAVAACPNIVDQFSVSISIGGTHPVRPHTFLTCFRLTGRRAETAVSIALSNRFLSHQNPFFKVSIASSRVIFITSFKFPFSFISNILTPTIRANQRHRIRQTLFY